MISFILVDVFKGAKLRAGRLELKSFLGQDMYCRIIAISTLQLVEVSLSGILTITVKKSS